MKKSLESSHIVRRSGDLIINICDIAPNFYTKLYAGMAKTALKTYAVPTLQGKIVFIADTILTRGSTEDIISGRSLELTHWDLNRLESLPTSSFYEMLVTGVSKNGIKVFSDDRVDFLAAKWIGKNKTREAELFTQFIQNYTIDDSVIYRSRFLKRKLSKKDTWIQLLAHAFTPLQIVEFLENLQFNEDNPLDSSLLESVFRSLRIKTDILAQVDIIPEDSSIRLEFIDRIKHLSRLHIPSFLKSSADIAFLVTPKGREEEIDGNMLAVACASEDKKIKSRAEKELERRAKFRKNQSVDVFAG